MPHDTENDKPETGFSKFWSTLSRSRLLGRLFPFRKPAILLLSYPRSGSSWAGKVLGLSPDVAYLREPINQGYQNHFTDGRPEESVVDPLESSLEGSTRDWRTTLFLEFLPPRRARRG